MIANPAMRGTGFASTGMPLEPAADKLDRLIKMAFGPVFGRAIRATFDPRAAVAAVPWYLSGGIAAANCIAAYAAKGAADAAASYVNLANPGTYDLTTAAAPDFASATGWTFNGTTQYLITGVTATNSLSWIFRYSGAVSDGAGALGAEQSGQVRLNYYPYFTATSKTYFRAGGDWNQNYVAGYDTGVAAATPTYAYWNGTSVGAVTGDLTGTTTRVIYIGINYQGTINADSLWPGVVQAFALYNIDIAAYSAALSTAIAAL